MSDKNAEPISRRYRGGCPRCGQYKWAFRLGLPKEAEEISCEVCADAGFETRGLRFKGQREWYWLCSIDPRKDKLFWEE